MPERKTENLRGAMLMVLSMAAFTTNDLFVKLLGAQLPLSQVLMLRGAVALLMIAGLCQFYQAWTIRYARKDWGLIALRCAADVCATYFFLNALINMPIANATAILQLLPLTVALGAALFLNELLGWRRMIAIGIGFLGMLMIVRPGAEGFSNYCPAAAACATAIVAFKERLASRAVISGAVLPCTTSTRCVICAT